MTAPKNNQINIQAHGNLRVIKAVDSVKIEYTQTGLNDSTDIVRIAFKWNGKKVPVRGIGCETLFNGASNIYAEYFLNSHSTTIILLNCTQKKYRKFLGDTYYTKESFAIEIVEVYYSNHSLGIPTNDAANITIEKYALLGSTTSGNLNNMLKLNVKNNNIYKSSDKAIWSNNINATNVGAPELGFGIGNRTIVNSKDVDPGSVKLIINTTNTLATESNDRCKFGLKINNNVEKKIFKKINE